MSELVFTSDNAEKLKSFTDFMNGLCVDNTILAGLEAERLKPYISVLNRQLMLDLDVASAITPDERKDMEEICSQESLTELFTRVAEKNCNTLLSEIIVAPFAIIDKDIEDADSFIKLYSYRDFIFSFGFVQVFERDKEKAKQSSTSMPVFGFDDFSMFQVEGYSSEKMLKAFQEIMTFGNHDMQHHYTSSILNNSIAENFQDASMLKAPITNSDWSLKWFTQNDDHGINSYENFLVRNHARIIDLMVKDDGGEFLREPCDRFFDELERIGKELEDAEDVGEAHEVVDYFGTMLCFSMMRFLPLNHEIMDHAVARLRKADPASHRLLMKAWNIQSEIRESEDMRETLDNYKSAGMNLEIDMDLNYVSLKKIQLISIMPWTARMMSPAIKGSELDDIQSKTADINLDMIKSTMTETRKLADGLHTNFIDGGVIEFWIKNGKLDEAENGKPSYLETREDGTKIEKWYKDGKRHRDDDEPAEIMCSSNGTVDKKWCQDGKVHRDNAPAVINILSTGAKREIWYQNDMKHRDGAAAYSFIRTSGRKTEEWYVNGEQHRDDGPAYTNISPEGFYVKEWYQHNKLHRDGKPAHIYTRPNGVSGEEWYQNDLLHCDTGPCSIRKFSDGSREDIWGQNGERHRIGDPAFILIDADGNKTERYFEHGNEIILIKDSFHKKKRPFCKL